MAVTTQQKMAQSCEREESEVWSLSPKATGPPPVPSAAPALSADMALRPPPRAPPFDDFDEHVAELKSQFNGIEIDMPEAAKSLWTESELQMCFASSGLIRPPDDPKLRALADKQNAKTDMRSLAERDSDKKLEEAKMAAMNAPWWEQVTQLDRDKAEMYRDAALARGIPHREHGLFPPDDPLLKQLTKAKQAMPFEKHILFWDTEHTPAKDGSTVRRRGLWSAREGSRCVCSASPLRCASVAASGVVGRRGLHARRLCLHRPRL